MLLSLSLVLSVKSRMGGGDNPPDSVSVSLPPSVPPVTPSAKPVETTAHTSKLKVVPDPSLKKGGCEV